LIPELIRIGVEILNPIQPVVNMEPERLKKDFGDRLTFYGGVDTQELLRNSKPLDVYEATRKLIHILSNNGGYILSAAHCIQEDIPAKNAVAMYLAGLGNSNLIS
jgi:uroporphyrinogen decarboxylase